MAQVELIMPKMGESIMEATILKWLKKEGDTVEVDETILEIATDKVDSEVPSPVSGTIAKILYPENEVVEIGKPIAIIATEGEEVTPAASPAVQTPAAPAQNGSSNGQTAAPTPKPEPVPALAHAGADAPTPITKTGDSGRFYSPLVRNIAKTEGISIAELERIPGTGLHLSLIHI